MTTPAHTEAAQITHTAIVSDDLTVYGIGQTSEQAWADAREWADRDSDGEPNLRGLHAVACTARLASYVEENGHADSFVVLVRDTVLAMRSEALSVAMSLDSNR